MGKKEMKEKNVPQEIKDLMETNVNTSNEGLVSSFPFLKWSGSFFKTITKVLDGISGITNNMIFFHL